MIAKKVAGWTLESASLLAAFLAIWVPFGGRGQWIASAILLFLAGAAFLGTTTSTTPEDPDRSSGGTEESETTSLPTNRPRYGLPADDREDGQ